MRVIQSVRYFCRGQRWQGIITVTTGLVAAGVALSGAGWAQVFSVAAMPDPQHYSRPHRRDDYNLYNRQSQWLIANQASRNIRHTIWLGDLSADNTSAQWNVAKAAYDLLDNAGLSYAVIPGNHDYFLTTWRGAQKRGLTLYNNILGRSRFVGKPWYGGTHLNGNENNYTYFSASGMDFLVVGLEYNPRKEAITWANNVISQHPNHRVIIFVHAYINNGGDYTGFDTRMGLVGASGQVLYDECVSRHSNVFLVACGHINGSAVNTKTGLNGNILHEMLVDYQQEAPLNGAGGLGNGWLRLLQFNPATNKIHADTYTVADGDTAIFPGGTPRFWESGYGSSPTAARHKFTLDYNMTNPLLPYSYLIGNNGFHATGIANSLDSDQHNPDIGQASNGDWVGVWAEDGDANGVYQIMIRGFDADANKRFNRFTVNTSGVNSTNATVPRIAVAPDGRFVVVWRSGTTAIKVREYAANGSPVGAAEQTVVSVPAGNVAHQPDVAVDSTGNYVVTWMDNVEGSNMVKARGFAPNYTQRFATKTVNTVATGNQRNPRIDMHSGGDYLIVWEDSSGGTWDIGARGFRADETEWVPQMTVNTTVGGLQASPDVAMDEAKRWVVIWEDDADGNGFHQIFARGFNAAGAERFGEMPVNKNAGGDQINPSIDMDSHGYWYAAWEDDGMDGTAYQIGANAFTPAGARVAADDVRVNHVGTVSATSGSPARPRRVPVVSAHDSGRYTVAWADNMDGDNVFQVLARGLPGRSRNLMVKSHYGTVAQEPAQPYYAPNEVVTLTAEPLPGYRFVRWSGGVTTTANPINLTMNDHKSVVAEYEPMASSVVAEWGIY